MLETPSTTSLWPDKPQKKSIVFFDVSPVAAGGGCTGRRETYEVGFCNAYTRNT
jgi:hypothetical protein